MLRIPTIIALLFLFAAGACRKDSFNSSPDAAISFSADTVFFDTVFVTRGSITASVKINNNDKQKILLSRIRLAGGSQSVFQLNIDGAAGPEASNIELAGNDSLYLFITVTINPSADSLPFILRDSIEVSFNGKQQYIQLEAWGQNAHFIKNGEIAQDITWTNDLPYVIIGGLQVDSGKTLTIDAGTRLYFHADAPLLVDGSLQVNGTPSDSGRVYFLGDRLDAPYSGFPGSWPGIYFSSSSQHNVFNSAVIRNSYRGLVAEDSAADGNPKLVLNQCIIDNVYNEGILGVHTSIQATNCLVSNCGSNIALGYGGQYRFDFCTVASYSNAYIQHQQPVLILTNYFAQGTGYLTADLHGQFTNCIFWGSEGNVDDEVVTSVQGSTVYDVSFSNCLWRVKTTPMADTTHIIANQDPLFVTADNGKRLYDFHLQSGSPARSQGLNTGVTQDLDGNSRPSLNPDLGAYQQ